MRFYDALQMDPADLKRQMAAADTKKQKRWFSRALILRAVLLVGFAVAFISLLTALFGDENSSMAVVIFCILLSVRFVNFGYNIRHSLANLAVIFALLLISPLLMQAVPLVLGFVINFLSMFLIAVMACENPEMGNGGLYLFGYIFLTGNPVAGEVFIQRCWMALTGLVLCGLVFYFKHRHAHRDASFVQVVRGFHIRDVKSQWQIQLALGVSLLFLIGGLLKWDRFMWVGFACSSLLSAYPVKAEKRFIERAGGVVAGSLLFGLLYYLLPEQFLSLLGPVSGLCLGFCATYPYKTIFNCFGALSLAAAVYGLSGSIALRIWNNITGLVFGYLFFYLCRKIFTNVHFKRPAEEETEKAA